MFAPNAPLPNVVFCRIAPAPRPTVSELIEELSKYPPDMPIGIFHDHGHCEIDWVSQELINEEQDDEFEMVLIKADM